MPSFIRILIYKFWHRWHHIYLWTTYRNSKYYTKTFRNNCACRCPNTHKQARYHVQWICSGKMPVLKGNALVVDNLLNKKFSKWKENGAKIFWIYIYYTITVLMKRCLSGPWFKATKSHTETLCSLRSRQGTHSSCLVLASTI